MREALSSRLLTTIRGNAKRLTETQGGSALWAEREWVQSLLPSEELDQAGGEAGREMVKLPFELELA